MLSSVIVDVQPWTGPSMTPKTTRPTAAADSSVPPGSRLTCSVDRLVGTAKAMAMKATRASSAAATNTELHE
jgi:hypothetical protein